MKTPGVKRCVLCLYQIGFGFTTIGRLARKNKSLCRKWVVKAGIQRKERKNSRTLRLLFGPTKGTVWARSDQVKAKFRAAFYRASIQAITCPWESWLREKERAMEYARTYCSRRREYYREKAKRHYLTKKNNPLWLQRRREESREWRKLNPEKRKYGLRSWVGRNRDRVAFYRTKQRKNPYYRIVQNLRHRLRNFAKRGARPVTSAELIGCSSAALRAHLERQFKGKMSWENYGTHWVIDHILPCASFDLTQSDEQRRCFHWTNLRPLTHRANQKKRDKILKPQQLLMLPA